MEVALMGWDNVNKFWRKVLVNDAGKLIIDPSEIYENVPTDNEHGKAPDSDWAYDHAANASAHHTRYTDAEAMNARYNNKLTLTTGTYLAQDVTGKGMILLNTAGGNITLKGLQGGGEGQMIVCVKTTPGNVLNIINDSGDIGVVEPFYTATGSDDNIPAGSLGIFYIISLGGYWLVSRHLNI